MDDYSIKMEDIPQSFFQDSEKKPFCNCTFCGKDLKTSNEPYVVEKSFKKAIGQKQHVTVFEYAICTSCSIKKMQVISKSSMATIQEFMEKNRSTLQDKFEAASYEEKLSSCSISGEKLEDMEEYNMVGQFIGDKMIVKEFPMIMNAKVGEEIQELLSKETKDEFDRFMDEVTDVPPELKELFKNNRPVLV